MYGPVTIPFGARMLFNIVRLKPGIAMEDVELALAEMCNVVKETYGNDQGGFVAGQVFQYSGFISEQGSVVGSSEEAHLAIVTYWKSYEQHEASHADAVFREKFAALAAMCSSTSELGYEMLWQGEPEAPANGADPHGA